MTRRTRLRLLGAAAAIGLAAAPAFAQTPMDDPLDARDAKRLDRMEKVVRELRDIWQFRDARQTPSGPRDGNRSRALKTFRGPIRACEIFQGQIGQWPMHWGKVGLGNTALSLPRRRWN